MRKYDAIYQDLKEKIEAEIYATGSLLPSESALQDMYQASRDTVRKALRLLKDDGFIQSQKGKGSTVINRQEYVFPVSGVVSYAELAAQLTDANGGFNQSLCNIARQVVQRCGSNGRSQTDAPTEAGAVFGK